MKIYFLTICSLLTFNLLFSQQMSTPESRQITVTGSAEVNVQPDEIELEIVLKEYGDYDKVSLAKIEKDFFEILEKNNIPKDKVIFSNSSYYWYYWWRYRKEIHKEKRYHLTLDKNTDFLSLMKDLDIKGVSSLSISKTTNTKLQDLRKDIKIQAVQAAKEKATYLLESIGEKLGRVISIEEIPDNPYNYMGLPESMSNISINPDKTSDEISNVATIKLRYEIKAKFEIQE